MIKATVVCLAFGFIYHKLSNNENLDSFIHILRALPELSVWFMVSLVVLLMLLNWFLEAVKWRMLVSRVVKISIWQSIESIFCGLTWAIFTPNRIGEYGGRVFFLPRRKRILGAVSMTVGQVGQMVITNILGSIAIVWFVCRFMELDFWLNYAFILLCVVYCLFFTLFYFNIGWLDGFLSRVPYVKNYRRFFGILAKYERKELLKVMGLCIGRFTVFTSQYCILILWLIPELHLFDTMMMVFILFFIQSALPSLDLLDVGVRSLTAEYFFKYITTESVAIMAVAASIWFINIIFPAILGTYFVFKLKFFDNNN